MIGHGLDRSTKVPHALENSRSIDHLVHQVEFSAGQILCHGVVIRHREGNLFYGGFHQVHWVFFALIVITHDFVDVGASVAVMRQRATASARMILHIKLEVLRQSVVNPRALVILIDDKVCGLVVVISQHVGT